MAINFGDIASFATGVVDADSAATAERLVDRRAELQADRQMHIDMKTKKYESELKAFEAEDKKFKAINSVKSSFKGKEPSPSEFGAAYLQETNPTLLYQIQKDYMDYPDLLQKQLAGYANNVNFKTTTTRDTLDTNLKTDVAEITSKYKKQLEAARGDSKLIKAILGKRDGDIAKVVKENEDGVNGAIIAKEIAVETDTNKDEFKLGEEKPIAFRVPASFIKAAKIDEKRTKLNSSDATKSYKDNAINTTVQFFNDNQVAKPSGFYVKDADKNITGFTGAGAKLNSHVSQLWGGAVESFTNEKVYIATNKTASNASNILNEGNVNSVIDERLRNYTYIQQPKKWFNDRENIVAIVPWSVVDVNNNLAGFDVKGKSNQKLVAEAYADALKDYTAANNIKITGQDSEGKNITSIIEPNQKFMNDIQSKLLSQKGNSSELSTDIQNRILDKLGVDREKNLEATDSNSTLTTTETTSEPTGSIKLTTSSGETKIVDDNAENRSLAETKGFTVEVVEINSKEPVALVPQETDEGYDPEYNTSLDKSVTAGTIRRLKRGTTIPMSRTERLESRKIEAEARKKNRELLANKKRNKSLGLPEVTPLTSE
tara:strand:- start:2056 stop:3858 length:1803 start_codon:yes stop_codon:yes gene_type:complete